MNEQEVEAYGKTAASAYDRSRNRENAIALMLHDHPELPVDVARCLWEAVDAYVDTHPNKPATTSE